MTPYLTLRSSESDAPTIAVLGRGRQWRVRSAECPQHQPRPGDSGTANAGAFRSDSSLSERVEHRDSGQLKVPGVAGDHGHAVHSRRGRDERVDHRQGLRILLTAPGRGNREGDGKNPVLEPGLHIPEPALERRSLVLVSAAANSRDPLLDRAQGQYRDMQLVLSRQITAN